jgi:hypothetical protein
VIPERRRHRRIIAKGTVVLHTPDGAVHGRLADVGEGGLRAVIPVGLRRWLEIVIDVELRLDGGTAEWLHGRMRIVRAGDDDVALVFETAPEAFGRVIDELTSESRARHRVLAVVVIDSCEPRRSTIVAGFRSLGCAVVETSTPLEAIVRLGESSFEPDVIAIADSQPAALADELRAFVRREHVQTTLVTIVDDAADDTASVSAAGLQSDVTRRIRALLSRVLVS